MSENNIIKSITIHTCPHCKGEVYIESQMVPPTVNSVFTAKEVEKAKSDCKLRVETLAISDEKKEAVNKWLESPETVFNESEIESIVLSLLKPE